jgi:hypothetical protein
MKREPNYRKGALWGAAFGVLSLFLQNPFGIADGPETINYYGGGALGGALIGALVAKLATSWRR